MSSRPLTDDAVEHLLRELRDVDLGDWSYSADCLVADGLIQALEQLKELRAAARYVVEDACDSGQRPYPGELIVQGRGVERLKTVLEGN